VNDVIIYAVASLGVLALVAAVILYFVAQRFRVFEDPRIDEVEEILPSANCGGCGYAGCRAFAEAIVKKGSMEGFNCPVGGGDLMMEVGKVLGLEAEISEPQIAVLRCNGSITNSPAKVQFDGIRSCASASSVFSGVGGCSYGCLGLGDCVDSCDFNAIHINPETMLPEVTTNCVACNACVVACPKNLLELRNLGKKERRIFVACMNEEKGAPAKKNCEVACIGCSKCFKVCPFDAIEMINNRAYIDFEKCKLCRKCEPVCPTNAIHEINFPLRKVKPAPEKKDIPKARETVKVAVDDNKEQTIKNTSARADQAKGKTKQVQKTEVEQKDGTKNKVAGSSKKTENDTNS
jgi:electron transport complex protein RnfB